MWVKTTERMPNTEGRYKCKVNLLDKDNTVLEAICRYEEVYDRDGEEDEGYLMFTFELQPFFTPPNYPRVVEWYDESIEQTPKRADIVYLESQVREILYAHGVIEVLDEEFVDKGISLSFLMATLFVEVSKKNPQEHKTCKIDE